MRKVVGSILGYLGLSRGRPGQTEHRHRVLISGAVCGPPRADGAPPQGYNILGYLRAVPGRRSAATGF